MTDNETAKDKLPGNHGQFGAGNATEAYKPLEQHPTPEQPAAEMSKPAEAKERG